MALKVKKIGHCCLLVSDGETTVMTDPGNTTEAQLEVRGLAAIIITHKHADHLDPDTIKRVAENNPGAVFIANEDVGTVLKEQGIDYETMAEGQERNIGTLLIKAFTTKHEHIYEGVPLPQNTGYFINETLYIPGDSYELPPVEISVLATPVGAPWGTIGDSVDFIKAVKPQKAFPIHDGMLRIYDPFHFQPGRLLPGDISFVPLKPDEELSLDVDK